MENEEIKPEESMSPTVEDQPDNNHSSDESDQHFVSSHPDNELQSAESAVISHERLAAGNSTAFPTNASFYPLDPGLIPAERLAGMILFGILFVAAIIGLLVKFFLGGFDPGWFILAGIAAAILLLQLWSAIFWPPIKYRNICWRLDRVGLEIHSGVIWKHRTSIPLARVQHADVSQGPIQRSYNLGTLTVHTAGTVGASIDLEGLGHHIALDLRDRLVRQRNAGDNVVTQPVEGSQI